MKNKGVRFLKIGEVLTAIGLECSIKIVEIKDDDMIVAEIIFVAPHKENMVFGAKVGQLINLVAEKHDRPDADDICGGRWSANLYETRDCYYGFTLYVDYKNDALLRKYLVYGN